MNKTKMAHTYQRGRMIASLAVGGCIWLLQLLRPQCSLTREQGEGATRAPAQYFCPSVRFVAGLHPPRENQQQPLAASLSEVDVSAGLRADPSFKESDCKYPNDNVGFEKAISKGMLQSLLERTSLISYRGLNSHTEVAASMHKDISCAIQTNSLFEDFCNTSEKSTNDDNAFTNLSECVAFIAHAAVRTHFWTAFSDSSRGRMFRSQPCRELTMCKSRTHTSVFRPRTAAYFFCGDPMRECSPNEKYPCGPPSASYHARGPFQLRGNEEYGAFGEALFQDAQRLLTEPDLVEPQGIGGWAAALWKWMTERPYGLNCPETMVRSGNGSCHAAMLHQDSPADGAAIALRDKDEAALKDAVSGFGLTIHINGEGAMDCCPTALRTLQNERAVQLQGALGGPTAAASALSPATSLGPAIAAPLPAGAAGYLNLQIPVKEQKREKESSLSAQEQLFRAVMTGRDPPAALLEPSPASSSVPPALPLIATPTVVPSAASPAQLLLPASPTQLLTPSLPGQSMLLPALGPPSSPPLTAALLVSTFLSFLAVVLPDVPAITTQNSETVLHPFSSARVPWAVPLPGSADGLCSTQGVLTLQAAAENADNVDAGRAAALESRFCLSVVRGCPSLFSQSAAQVSSKSVDETAAKAVDEATASHPHGGDLHFKCFETSATGFAAAATTDKDSPIDVVSVDEEKMKNKLNATKKEDHPASFPYLPRSGVTCAFFSTKTSGW